MTRSTRILIVSSCLCFGATRMIAQRFDTVSVVRRVAGCWTVTMSTYAPPMVLRGDSVYSKPPRRIELDSMRGAGPFARDGWALSPARGVPLSVHRFSYFHPIAGDSLELVWTSGFSGLTIRAAISADTLRGVARTFWDFGRPEQLAPVVLTRDCP